MMVNVVGTVLHTLANDWESRGKKGWREKGMDGWEVLDLAGGAVERTEYDEEQLYTKASTVDSYLHIPYFRTKRQG